MRENIVKDKSLAFAINVVKIARLLKEQKKEYVLSHQMLRSGTAVGAMIREAEYAESQADFTHKMAISLKEANETEYWLDLMFEALYIDAATYTQSKANIKEIIRLLIAIIKTSKQSDPK